MILQSIKHNEPGDIHSDGSAHSLQLHHPPYPQLFLMPASHHTYQATLEQRREQNLRIPLLLVGGSYTIEAPVKNAFGEHPKHRRLD